MVLVSCAASLPVRRTAVRVSGCLFVLALSFICTSIPSPAARHHLLARVCDTSPLEPELGSIFASRELPCVRFASSQDPTHLPPRHPTLMSTKVEGVQGAGGTVTATAFCRTPVPWPASCRQVKCWIRTTSPCRRGIPGGLHTCSFQREGCSRWHSVEQTIVSSGRLLQAFCGLEEDTG